MAAKPLVRESLLLLNITGVQLHNSAILSKLRLILYEILLMYVCVEILLNIIYNWEGLESMEDLTAFLGLCQVGSKLLTMAVNRNKLVGIIAKIEEFWPYDKCSEKLQSEIATTYTFVKRSLAILGATLTGTISLYNVQPLFSAMKKLPLRTYHPSTINESPTYEVVYFMQAMSTFVAIPIVIGFDSLFVALIITIIFELKLIKEELTRLPINSKTGQNSQHISLKLSQLINHHDFVLECIRDMNDVYYLLLLNVFLSDMICICVGLLCIIADGIPPTIQTIFKYGLYVMYFVIQLLFYCASGSLLTVESESVSAAIYDTDWWIKTQPQLRRAYVLMIQRANKSEKLTAGGMFDLNLESFTKILRSALSFFTFVQAMYKTSD